MVEVLTDDAAKPSDDEPALRGSKCVPNPTHNVHSVAAGRCWPTGAGRNTLRSEKSKLSCTIDLLI